MWTIKNISEDEALANAIAKMKARFPNLANIKDDKVVARNACRLSVAGLSGPELLALANAAGPLTDGEA